MLSTTGRLSAIVMIAASSLLLRENTANAAEMSGWRACNAAEEQYVCELVSTAWYYDDGYWCASGYNSCEVNDDDPMNPQYNANVNYSYNGNTPCPPVLPGACNP